MRGLREGGWVSPVSERDIVRIRHQRCRIPAGRFGLGRAGGWRWRCWLAAVLFRCSRSGSRSDRMQARQGEFRTLLLHPIATGHGVHPQPSLDQQSLTHLHSVLQVLGEISPANDLELSGRITIAKRVESHRHLGDRGLIVLGVPNRRSVDYLHFQHAVVHGHHRFRETS